MERIDSDDRFFYKMTHQNKLTLFFYGIGRRISTRTVELVTKKDVDGSDIFSGFAALIWAAAFMQPNYIYTSFRLLSMARYAQTNIWIAVFLLLAAHHFVNVIFCGEETVISKSRRVAGFLHGVFVWFTVGSLLLHTGYSVGVGLSFLFGAFSGWGAIRICAEISDLREYLTLKRISEVMERLPST